LRSVAAKDVGEYADSAEATWMAHGIEAEGFPDRPIFEYVRRPVEPAYSRGRLLVRLSFPGHARAYLKVEEWLVGDEQRIHRESFVYELIYDGAVLENWHRDRIHRDHSHRGIGPDERREPIRAPSLKQAIEICLDLLWGGRIPELGGLGQV